jgi:hypothetical protein
MIVLLVLSLLLLLSLSLTLTLALSLAHSESKKKTDENTGSADCVGCAFALLVSFLLYTLLSGGAEREINGKE